MRRFLAAAAIAGGIAWYLGWRPQVPDVPGLISDRAGCDPSYPTVCIPPPPPHLGCDDVDVRDFKVFGADPHRFDPDRDGRGC